jgi:hypothetical protein
LVETGCCTLIPSALCGASSEVVLITGDKCKPPYRRRSATTVSPSATTTRSAAPGLRRSRCFGLGIALQATRGLPQVFDRRSPLLRRDLRGHQAKVFGTRCLSWITTFATMTRSSSVAGSCLPCPWCRC